MRQLIILPIAACLLLVHLAARGAGVIEKETITRSFVLDNTSSATRRFEVDNFEGSIKVTGCEGNEARLTVRETLEGDSPEKIMGARRDVRLEITRTNDAVFCFVDGPFRCRNGSIHFDGWEHYGYKVRFDFELAVPRPTGLRLKTVNGDEIVVEKTAGPFDVDNINGGARLTDVSGSGRVYALNGGVHVSFVANPETNCFFGSLNGKVEVFFLPGLSANVWLKTFNGHAYSDFPMTTLPTGKPTRKSVNGKFIYKSDDFFGARVGGGGPELKFDAFNGDIRILSRQP